MANTLIKTVVWQKWFEALDAEEILKGKFSSKLFVSRVDELGSFTYTLDDKFMAKNENSEAHLRVINLNPGALPFKTIFSLYIGVGGL